MTKKHHRLKIFQEDLMQFTMLYCIFIVLFMILGALVFDGWFLIFTFIFDFVYFCIILPKYLFKNLIEVIPLEEEKKK